MTRVECLYRVSTKGISGMYPLRGYIKVERPRSTLCARRRLAERNRPKGGSWREGTAVFARLSLLCWAQQR